MIQHGPIAGIGSCGPVFLSCRQGDERTKATSSARGLREPEAPAWRDPTDLCQSTPMAPGTTTMLPRRHLTHFRWASVRLPKPHSKASTYHRCFSPRASRKAPMWHRTGTHGCFDCCQATNHHGQLATVTDGILPTNLEDELTSCSESRSSPTTSRIAIA